MYRCLFIAILAFALSSCATTNTKYAFKGNMGYSYSQVEKIKLLTKQSDLESELGKPGEIIEFKDSPDTVQWNYGFMYKKTFLPRLLFVINKNTRLVQSKGILLYDENIVAQELIADKFPNVKFERRVIESKLACSIGPREIVYENKELGLYFSARPYREPNDVTYVSWSVPENSSTPTNTTAKQ